MNSKSRERRLAIQRKQQREAKEILHHLPPTAHRHDPWADERTTGTERYVNGVRVPR